MRTPRIAYFPDSFHEINGVAHTSRNFVAFAERQHLPFLCVRAGRAPARWTDDVCTLDLPRSRAAFRLEKDLDFDPLFLRHARTVQRTLKAFQPDLIHITGPSELGILGAYFAWKLGIPLAASWHTNVHEYAAKRFSTFTRHLGPDISAAIGRRIESASLWAASRFYRLAHILFAPNTELCGMLERATGTSTHLMQRGVDAELFSPAHRCRPSTDTDIVLGFVGRLSIEKNVLLLPHIERELIARGMASIRLLIVGHGNEEPYLRSRLSRAEFPGVLRGHELAQAYADMDLFLFPSHTDTFGNVVLEALASGVPAIVTKDGGPKYIVRDGETGYVVADAEFPERIAQLIQDPQLLASMRDAARTYAQGCSWDAVFSHVYAAYRTILPEAFRE